MDWPSAPQVPEAVICRMPPPDSVFLDTNTALDLKVVRKLRSRHRPLISAIVYGELLARKPRATGYPETLAKLLQDHDIHVVPFDPMDAVLYWRLLQAIPLGPPLVKAGETEHTCLRRLRFDLFVFAVALRYRKLLLTNNTAEYQYFPFEGAWTRPEQYVATLGSPE